MEIVREWHPAVDDIKLGMENKFRMEHSRPDLHVTDTLYCLRKAYWDKLEPLPPTPNETMYFLLGLGLQEVLIGGQEQHIVLDGIMLSPDYITSEGLPLELKTTRIGQKRLLEHNFPEGWIRQMMCYCKALEVYQAVLVVIPMIKPEMLSFRLYFTEEEIVENWKQVQTQALRLVDALFKEELPPVVGKADEWQCANCRFELRCASRSTG